MTVAFAFPGLALLWCMRGTIGRYEAEQAERALAAKPASA